jgi:hypothetical protein
MLISVLNAASIAGVLLHAIMLQRQLLSRDQRRNSLSEHNKAIVGRRQSVIVP